MTEPARHWDDVYEARGDDVSWFQAEPQPSLSLIEALAVPLDAAVVDVGGGTSSLVDHLARRGHTDLTVLDISAAALHVAQARLGDAPVRWVQADVRTWEPERSYALWHDRAVFHFLTDVEDRDRYLATLQRAVPEGAVVLGTFAPDGPEQCSGLPVTRYGADELADLLTGFDVVDERRHVHVTPHGVEQPFTFVAARRR